MHGTCMRRERPKIYAILSHMAQAWLRLANQKHDPGASLKDEQPGESPRNSARRNRNNNSTALRGGPEARTNRSPNRSIGFTVCPIRARIRRLVIGKGERTGRCRNLIFSVSSLTRPLCCLCFGRPLFVSCSLGQCTRFIGTCPQCRASATITQLHQLRKHSMRQVVR
jgi:hypothetical protein